MLRKSVFGQLRRGAILPSLGVLGVMGIASGVRTARKSTSFRPSIPGYVSVETPTGRLEANVVRGRDADRSSPLVVFENGLGTPIETWQWVVENLPTLNCVRYNRAGYGESSRGIDVLAGYRYAATEFPEARTVVYVGHSIGSLAIHDVLARLEPADRRPDHIVLVDGTDPVLFRDMACIPERLGKVTQSLELEILSSLFDNTRRSRAFEDDMDYPRSIHEAHLAFSSCVATQLQARREFLRFVAAPEFAPLGVPVSVVAADSGIEGAEGHAAAQRALADRVNATSLTVVPHSNHLSVIGFRSRAREVAEHVLTVAERSSLQAGRVVGIG
ncbi:alpha/beta hydrolase [Rhodococcus sp. IEGM 1354]|uniref:alpha/beta fold hydrolase n=1 Tax=Rhodococcus sp. IEGM 1354 TaxID=3047088 RepID=UPI0024B70E41|nr:alpha/beta hydrolase [Rhodococcus sp. IEGM 1354]MDI9930575.1 alpha/beta hydrolase [Rhodococcus sp. IEGM 1354]